MKEGIHPKYYNTSIRCACGNVIETGSTRENITVVIYCPTVFVGQFAYERAMIIDRYN